MTKYQLLNHHILDLLSSQEEHKMETRKLFLIAHQDYKYWIIQSQLFLYYY